MSTDVIREERGNVIFYRLQNFDVNDFMPTAEHETALAGEITNAILSSDSRIALIGHASRTGGESDNLALSLRRAETVRDFLSSQGVVAVDRLVIMAEGESPRKPDNIEDHRERAVRVVIVGHAPDAEDEPSGQMSIKRPPKEALFELMEVNEGLFQLYTEYMIINIMPDVLNIVGPSSAGLGREWAWLDIIFHGNQARSIFSERPDSEERFERDRERTLNEVWNHWQGLLALKGLSFNEEFEIINESGAVVERPFKNINMDSNDQ